MDLIAQSVILHEEDDFFVMFGFIWMVSVWVVQWSQSYNPPVFHLSPPQNDQANYLLKQNIIYSQ